MFFLFYYISYTSCLEQHVTSLGYNQDSGRRRTNRLLSPVEYLKSDIESIYAKIEIICLTSVCL